MKLQKATTMKIHHDSVMLSMKQIKILSAHVILGFFLHGVKGQIDCGSASGNPDVCFDNPDTFLCDEFGDNCFQSSFNRIRGTTSKCSRKDPASSDDICFETEFSFDDSDTEAQQMTCNGYFACNNVEVFFGENAAEGTLVCEGLGACHFADVFFPTDTFKGKVICKGGSFGKPTCPFIQVDGGCLICEDTYSCYNPCVYAGFSQYDTCKDDEYFQGSMGVNCPKKYKLKPALPCFSGTNVVEVQGKGLIAMGSLKVGDHVWTGMTYDGKPQFSRIMSLMHKDLQIKADYLQIFTDDARKVPLEISADHFLYLYNDKIIRARDVKIGDILKGGATRTVVTHVQNIQRQGLFAPATENGKIWVSGVSANSYISLFEGNIIPPNMQAWMSHIALGPLRMVCKFGIFYNCENETHSKDGFSMNLLMLIKFGLHFMAYAIPMQILMLIVSAPLLAILASFEWVLNNGIMASTMTGVVIFIFKLNTNTK